MGRKFIFFLLLVPLIALLAILMIDPRQNLPAPKAFEIVEDFPIYNVFDAGLADLNGDGLTDRWTVNHSAAQWVRFGVDGQTVSGAANGLARSGLFQDAAMPGFEGGVGPVPAQRPIRIYMRDAHFVVDADGLMPGERARGYFDIPWDTEFAGFGGAAVDPEPCDTRPNCHRLRFEVPDGGRVELLPVPPPSDGFPISITLDPETDLGRVQLGAMAIEPQAHTFTYASRDRHALALADLPGRARPVIFVSRGGARGRMPEVHPEARDELFEWAGDGFRDVISGSGIEKDGCPGRQAGWLDINGDGALDLYQVCGRSGSGAKYGAAGNRLYLQRPDGSFVEDAASIGLDLPHSGVFRVLPHAAGSAPSAILWVTEGNIALFGRGEAGIFERRWHLEAPVSGTEKILLHDLGGDGTWDAFIFSPKGNLVVPLADEQPTPRDLNSLGLPSASADGAIADFNGDGFRDILTLPQGIHLRDGDRFVATDLIDLSWTDGLQARVVPIDSDHDGDLDIWILARAGAEVSRVVRAIYNRSPRKLQEWIEAIYGRSRLAPRYWRSVLYENEANTGQATVLRSADMSGHANRFGEAYLAKIRMPAEEGGLQARFVFTGMDDPSRYSHGFPDIVMILPDGAELVSVEPVSDQKERQ